MRTVPVFLLAFFLISCSSTPERPAFSDFMEIREVKADDPLAAKFYNEEEEEIRLGDPIVTGKTVSRLQVKPFSEDQFDLHVTLLGADDSRWRRFARSRGRKAALIVNGKVRSVFDVADPGAPTEGELLVVRVPAVARTQEAADALDSYLETGRTARRAKKEEK